MKINRIFVVTSIPNRRGNSPFIGGYFYTPTANICGSVTPCRCLMARLPLWCRTTGKAEPFFISAQQTFLVMSNTREKCLNGKDTPRSNRRAHDTSESIYSKFLIEMQAKNKAYDFILSNGLLEEFIKFSRSKHSCSTTLAERMNLVMKNI